jgi:hypothetical protein
MSQNVRTVVLAVARRHPACRDAVPERVHGDLNPSTSLLLGRRHVTPLKRHTVVR